MQELAKEKDDPDSKALACYGLYVSANGSILLRFVDGRPVSSVTITFLEWLCEQMAASGKHVLVLIWDNASWHVSKQVKTCCVSTIKWCNKRLELAKVAYASSRAGWQPRVAFINRIEPKWVHGKRAIVEPARFLTAKELRQRVCDYFGYVQTELLTQSS